MIDVHIPLESVTEYVYINRHEGRGGVFSRDLVKESKIFTDRPLYSYIHEFSRKCVIVCDNCYLPIGSVVDNVNHLLKLHRKSLTDEAIRSIRHIQDGTRVKDIVSCLNCDRKYCCIHCMEEAKDIHDMFCQRMTKEELRLWKDFHRYCLRSDENLYFVGSIYANMLVTVLSEKRTLIELIEELSVYYEGSRNISLSHNGEGNNSIGNRLTRVSEAFTLMMKALDRFVTAVKVVDELNSEYVFQEDYFSLLLTKIELVAVDIEIENPLNKQLRRLMQIEDIERSIGKQLLSVKMDLYGIDALPEDVDADELELPDILGLGIYKCLSRLNHSCDPNLEVEYLENNVASVRLLRRVIEGTQATISYIDENLPVIQRRDCLWENYHFVCRCTKCVLEDTRTT